MLNFNQNAWLKPYIDANTDLRIKPKNNIETYFNNVIFGKTMQTVRKHKDIKLAIIERRKNYLVSKPNYHPIKLFTENLFEIEMRKIKVLMNKPSNLGFSILELSKILMCEFWYDYVKPKYGEKAKLCYMDTDSFIVYIKTGGIYKNIAQNVETRSDTSNYELDRPLPKRKKLKK